MPTYKITESYDASLIGTTFECSGSDEFEITAASIQHMESHGYSEWCDEHNIGSYDFEYERVYD